jgi:hypothetical protein
LSVRGQLAFTDEELDFLRALCQARVEFMIVGLSAAALQGAPMVTQDVDLWFRDVESSGIRKALRRVGGAFVPSIGLAPPMFAGEGVDLFDIVLTVHGVGSFEEEYANALEISMGSFAVKVLPLDRIIRSKCHLNRRKDRMVLPALRAAARAIAGASPPCIEHAPRGRSRSSQHT